VAGQFAAGSMRPKIETAIDFVRNSSHTDAVAIIAHVNHFADALDGRSGTRITVG
jgi:carbamate kinase